MNKFIPLSVFAVSFALVEAAVVVYLRQLYYPEGFSFPLKVFPDSTLWMEMLRIEMLREAATLAILFSVGVLAGRGAWQKFAFFMYAFGLWDIFYYVWLKVFLNWPESLLTPDILFLLPVAWWGPVLAPVIVALSLCISAVVLVHLGERGHIFKLKKIDVAWVTFGALIILYTFMADYKILEAGENPPPYRWGTFFIGEAIGIIAFVKMLLRK